MVCYFTTARWKRARHELSYPLGGLEQKELKAVAHEQRLKVTHGAARTRTHTQRLHCACQLSTLLLHPSWKDVEGRDKEQRIGSKRRKKRK